jgi:hypothetical protein
MAASTWTSDGLNPFSREHHSAFVFDKGQEKKKPPKPLGGRAKKTSSSESIECFVCGNFGHRLGLGLGLGLRLVPPSAEKYSRIH